MARTVAKRRRRLTPVAVLLCALVASLAVTVGPAAAEEGDSAPLRPMSEGGFSFPDITGPTAPEEYPMELDPVSPEMRVRQVTDQLIVGEYKEGGFIGWSLEAEPAHDAVGAAVPTTVRLTAERIVTLIVHHRAGNPTAGGAPFVYPITGGAGWAGGFFTGVVELNNPQAPKVQPQGVEPPPVCVVPALHDLSLRAATVRLRAAHCPMGDVRRGPGVRAVTGKVVKQFPVAGIEIPAGDSVAVKLGPGKG